MSASCCGVNVMPANSLNMNVYCSATSFSVFDCPIHFAHPPAPSGFRISNGPRRRQSQISSNGADEGQYSDLFFKR